MKEAPKGAPNILLGLLDFSSGDHNHGAQRVQARHGVPRRHRPHVRRVVARLAGAAAREAGAPNVLFIVLDDTGFGQLGCYGCPINTPNLDALAADGLRYNNMHTTALCSPIALVHAHRPQPPLQRAWPCITEGSTGYPGGNGYIPFENGFLSEILLQHGYNTYAIGKWHLTPAEQTSRRRPLRPLAARPRLRALLRLPRRRHAPVLPGAGARQHQVEPEKTPEEGYHLTRRPGRQGDGLIADAKQVAPDKPFFMYFCTGAMHAPHHVPKEWADKYKGKFDDGWDAYREQVFEQQKELGIVPKDAEAVAPRSRRAGLGQAARPTSGGSTRG